MPERIFSATVNGKRRQVLIWMEAEYANDVDEAEMVVMNDEAYYNSFYKGATNADLIAGLVNPRVRKPRT